MLKNRRGVLIASVLALGALAVSSAHVEAAPADAKIGSDEKVTIRVSYAPAHLSGLYEAIATRFMENNPEIKVILDSPAADYQALTQQILRQKITGELPDVTHEGLNQIRILADRGIAVPLNNFVAEDPTWKDVGVPDSVKSFASFQGKSYGLPFAISAPVIFYNATLIKRAGGDPNNLPTDWTGIINLANKVKALGPENDGIYVEYTNGGWSFQMLVGSFGGRMMNDQEQKVEFNGPAGLQAMNLLQRLGKEGQPSFGRNQARQAFSAGTLAMLATTSAELHNYQRAAAGKFEVKVGPFPVSSTNARLPAAGNGLVMLTQDREKQQAAWEYIKFAIGPVGQLIMAETTGYVPVNVAGMQDPNGLGKYFKDHPEQLVPADRLPLMTGWYTFPGDNTPQITKAIEDVCYEVVTLKREPEDAMADLTKTVNTLLPH